MPAAGKSGAIESNPNTQTIKFGGLYVNLSAIARTQGIDHSYLSRIFSGKRNPSLEFTKRIAAILGMTLDDFVVALENRVTEIAKYNRTVLEIHSKRIEAEDKADLAELEAGRLAAPRLPALRSA